LVPLGVVCFIEHFGAPLPGRRLRIRTITALASSFAALAFSPWIVAAVTREAYGMRPLYGVLHPLFAVYLVVGFGLAAFSLVSKYRQSTGLSRTQAGYLFLAFIVPGVLATTTNVLVPLLARTSAYNGFGPIFSLIMIAMVAHAIIRHRLMDIRIVIRRGVVYLVTFLTSATIFALMLIGSNTMLPREHGFSVRDVLLALIVAVLFESVKSRVQRVFDRYLYRDPYDYARTLKDASRGLTATIDLDGLLKHVWHVLSRTLHCEDASIYLFDPEDRLFALALSRGLANPIDVVATDDSIAVALISEPRILFCDEVAPYPKGSLKGNLLSRAMAERGAEAVVPLIEENQVIGFIILGAKRSGDPYFTNDVDLLTTLANQAAVAVRNAQTHARVVHMNEQLNKVLETIESGVVALGPRGRITLFNRAAERLTGTPTRLARGQSPQGLPAPLPDLLQATAADGQARSHVEFALPDPAGRLTPLICSTLPLRGPEGTVLGAVAVLNDISRLKELEQEKRRAERLASIEAITSGLIHEIRNPLVSMKTYAQLLPQRWSDEDFRDKLSRTTTREVDRIDDLLSRFRTVSRVAVQPMETVEIAEPLHDALETLHAQLEDRQIRLRQIGDVAGRTVLGNASQLQQLFLNLCLNAIQAMERNGELTVRVVDIPESGSGTLSVEVADTGPGIPEELLPTVFDPFVTTKPHGTGLGLAICRGIADAHHARLAVRNHSGRPGCTFTVEFPLPSARPSRVTP
jgi:PAS domain S-box-containing protein